MTLFIGTSGGDIARVTVTNSSSNTSVTINKPANVVTGDLMVLKLSAGGALNPNSLGLPAGWTPIADNFSANGSFAFHTAYAWRIAQAGDTSWTATIGANTTDDESFVFRVTGHDASTPIDAQAGAFTNQQTASPVCPTVTTVTANSVAIFGVSQKSGNILTADDTGQPTGTTLIQSKRSRSASSGINSGLAYLVVASPGATGTKTWSSYTSSAVYGSTFSFAIRPSAVGVIDDVNGNEHVLFGSTGNTLSTTNITPTSGNIGGKPITSIAGSAGSFTFAFPWFVDGQVTPEPQATSLMTITDGTSSPTIPIYMDLPAPWTSIVAASPNITDSTYIGYHLAAAGHTPVNGDRFVTNTNDWTMGADGGGSAPTVSTTTLWHWVNATDTIYEYTVTINILGGVVDMFGARQIIAVAITARPITARAI